jgi:digalactosyldiacylglycerol synthase
MCFYARSYHDEYHSIFPMGDITALIPDADADICVLEEPEHLNW